MSKKSQPPPKDSDLFPPVELEPEPLPPPRLAKAKAEPPPPALRVTAVELQTAPDHALVVRLSGETEELAALKRKILRSLHPEDGTEAGLLPLELQSALPA